MYPWLFLIVSDFSSQADGQKFSAHKIILAASIPYFQGMFMHDMVEANKAEIPMKGMESKWVFNL